MNTGSIDKNLLEILACPVSGGSLVEVGPELWCRPKHDDDNSAFSDFGAPIHDKTPSTNTDHLFGASDPRRRFRTKLGNKLEEARQTYLAYQSRIETLRGYAALEGLTVNHLSEQDFWSFVASVPFARKGGLVLLDNGTLRAVWDEEDDRHLGIQFLGERMLQFVIFGRKKRSRHISRVAGRGTFEEIKEQVRLFGLEAFLNA